MELTKSQLKVIADLKVQAMIFDMDIDWETLSLTPKTIDNKPFWLIRWQDKLNNSDRPNTAGLEGVDNE